MPLHKYVLVYMVSLVTFLVVDFTWLGTVAEPFYQRQLGTLLRTMEL